MMLIQRFNIWNIKVYNKNMRINLVLNNISKNTFQKKLF